MKIADKLMRGPTGSQYRDADWNRICLDNEWDVRTRSGYRLIAISPAVGGAAGWAGDMVQWRAPPEIDVKLAAVPARRRGRPPSGRTLVPFRRGSEPRRQPNQANHRVQASRPALAEIPGQSFEGASSSGRRR